jgi:hypothetical protein
MTVEGLLKVKNTSVNSLRSAKSSIRIIDANGCLPTAGLLLVVVYINAFFGLSKAGND